MIAINTKIKLSIIVPVYNTEKYLSGCLNSLLDCKTNEYEIILVDDGSSDSSPALCDRYAERFDHIRVIHQKNAGLANARNACVRIAVGEFLTFVDSDDTVDAGYADSVLEHIKRNDDIIVYGYRVDYTQTQQIKKKQLKEMPSVDAATAVRELEENGCFNMVCMKVYRNRLLQEQPQTLFIPHTEPGEDLIFNCECFMKAKSISLVNESFYHWIRRGEDTLANCFRDDLYEKNRMFIDYRNRLYQVLGMDDSQFSLLSKGNLTYIFSCIPNMYRKGHIFSKDRRMAFYREILDSKDVALWVNNTTPENMLHQRFIRLYQNGSAERMDFYYRTALWARNTFDGLWRMIRKRTK